MLGGRALVVYAGDRMPGLREERDSSRTVLTGYALPAGFVALALAISMLLRPVLPIAPFLGAVLASAWFGGWRGGLLSLVLSIAAIGFVVRPPTFDILSAGAILPRIVAFAIAALMLMWASARVRTTERALRAANLEIERAGNGKTASRRASRPTPRGAGKLPGKAR
jgi:K+-sensing histidine kinase KdpD